MPDSTFWKGRRGFLTGHTGFKGTWLSMIDQHADIPESKLQETASQYERI